MKLIHHGAKTGVTGSCHELFISPNASLLVDCGMFQGEEEGRQAALDLGFDPSHARCLIVTHCHIDHVGRIPALLAAGFTGPIYCSEATALLLPEVLEDAVKLGVTRDRRLVEQFSGKLQSQLYPVPYGVTTQLTQFDDAAVSLRFECAGHILGAAYVVLAAPVSVVGPHARNADQARAHILFSGDLGAKYTPLLPDPTPPPVVDVLVVESTYGDREHEDRASRQQRLEAVVAKTLEDRGTTIIPAFSIGRTQELLYELESVFVRLAGQAEFARLPVIVDSPMAAKFTKGYEKLKKLWDEEASNRLAEGRNPLVFPNLVVIESHEQHMALVNRLAQKHESAIVIAASGMCAGGRVVNYLKALISEPSTDVIFVGYQASGTPGRAIQLYGPKGGWVELDGERHDVRAGIHTLGGYSAHADRRDLVDFCQAADAMMIRVVHGEPEVQRAFGEEVRRKVGCGVELGCEV